MNDHLDRLDERISRHLHDQTSRVDVGAPSMVHVRRRAHQRRNRRRTAFGVAGTAAVSAATIFGIQALSRPHTSRLVPAQPTEATTPEGVTDRLLLVPSNLIWNRFEPDSARAVAATAYQVAAGDGFLAWATQPGRSTTGGVSTVYRSSDGINWDPVSDVHVDRPDRLTAGGGRLYSFATSPAAAAGVADQPAVELSTDGARTWQPIDLPIDLGDLSGLNGKVQASIGATIVAGDHGTMAILDIRPRPTAALAAEYPGAGFTSDGLAMPDPCVPTPTTTIMETPTTAAAGATGATSTTTPGSTGMTSTAVPGTIETTATTATAPDAAAAPTTTPGLVGASSTTAPGPIQAPGAIGTTTVAAPAADPVVCAASSQATSGTSNNPTWSELGVDPATAAIFSEPSPVFVSTDGEHFTRAGSLPPLPDGATGGLIRAISTIDGYAVVRSVYTATTEQYELLTSADGANWTTTQLPLYPSGFGQLADGALAIVGYSNSAFTVAVLRDGVLHTGAFDDLLAADDGPYARLQGDFGTHIDGNGITMVTAVTTDRVKAAGQPSVTRDGVTLKLLDMQGNTSAADATTGAELDPPIIRVDTTTGTKVWTVTATDGSTVEFSAEEIDGLYPGPDDPNAPRRLIVLHSDDGLSWSREDLAALSGLDQSAEVSVASAGTQSILSATEWPIGDRTPDGPLPPTIVLVGTPKS